MKHPGQWMLRDFCIWSGNFFNSALLGILSELESVKCFTRATITWIRWITHRGLFLNILRAEPNNILHECHVTFMTNSTSGFLRGPTRLNSIPGSILHFREKKRAKAFLSRSSRTHLSLGTGMETGTYWILLGSTGHFYCHRGGVVKGNLLRHPISKACEDHPVLENEMSENGSLQFSWSFSPPAHVFKSVTRDYVP